MLFFSKTRRKWRRHRQSQGAVTPPVAPDSAGPRTLTFARSPNTDAHLPPIVTHITPNVPTVSRPDASETTLTGPDGGLSPTATPNHAPPTTPAANPDIWAEAYENFVKREPELATDYKTHLATASDVATARPTGSLSPDSAKSIVEQLQEKRKEKQWHVTFHGKDVKFRAQAEKLAKFFVWCNGIVKNALSAQPYAALAWSGVSILLPLLTSGAAQHESMLLGFDSVNRVLIYWKAYQDAFPGEVGVSDTGAVWDGLVDLYSHVFEYQARVICHLSSAQLARAWQKIAGWNDWEKKASHLASLSNHCKSCTDITLAKEAQRTCDQQLRQMYESRAALQQIFELLEGERKQRRTDRDDQQERALLADLAADHEAYKNFNPPKVEGTCAWFLEDVSFRSWRDSAESGLLWVSAGPGCGKSVLSRSLIDDWQLSTSAATSTVCYFFFKDGDERREHSYDALSAILHQLFIQDLTGKFTSHAFSPHKNYGPGLRATLAELWNILLSCAATPGAGEIVCVLDALDECREDERNTLVGKLHEFFSLTGAVSHRTCSLKFFITSRPYDTIERSIGRLLNSSCLRIDGDDYSAAISRDINRVIDAMVPQLIGHLTERDRHRVSERLKAMENRTYLWLRLTFDIIEKRPSGYGRPSDVDRLLEELPNGHAAAYEKMLDLSYDATYTAVLLRIVLAATRPLSLDEANYALALAVEKSRTKRHSEVELWSEGAFRGAVKNFSGLLIDVHDSKLSFIHQTVREFLTQAPKDDKWRWKGCFKLPTCHGVMSLSCIRYLSLPEVDKSLDDTSIAAGTHPFFSYAAEHWPFHYREQDADTCNSLLEQAHNLCCITGSGKQWMQAHNGYDEWTWSQWTDLALAAYFGLEPLVRAIVASADVVVDADCGDFGTALQAASAAGFSGVVQTLLHHGADTNTACGVYQTPMSAAVANGHTRVVETLLKERGNHVKITQDVVVAAAENQESGQEIMALLLEEQGGQVEITQDVVVAAAGNRGSGGKILALLLKERGDQVEITQDVIVAAAGNRGNGKEIMALLLRERGARLGSRRTSLSRRQGVKKLMTLLLEEKGDQVEVTQGIVTLLAMSFGYQHMSLLLEKWGDQVKITQDVIVAAARNRRSGKEILALLLKKRGDQVVITQDVVIAAARNERTGKEILALLLKKRGNQVEITQDVVVAAARNRGSGGKIIALLLEKRGDQVKIPSVVIVAAVSNWRSGKQIMALLFEKRGDQVKITQNVVAAAAGNEDSGREVMALLLKERGDQVEITPDVVAAALRNRYCGEEIMALLLKKREDQAETMQDVAAAAGDEWSGEIARSGPA
ncbi:hypothetical protein PG984_000037 [Apiospora sp. TS-2023a]